MRRFLQSLLRREEGVAMATVVGAMSVVTLLGATTYAVAVESQHSSSRDRDSKRALAAAEAGLQMAYLKLSEVRPSDSYCVTDAAVLPGTNGAAAGECPAFTGSLGNGATYAYVVSTTTSGTCTLLPGKTATTKDRCITSIGTVNGVKRRLQTRVSYTPPLKPFSAAGLVARNDVHVRSSETNVSTTIGANGNVQVTHGAIVNGSIKLGPDGTWSYSNGGTTLNGQPPSYNTDPYEFLSDASLDALYEAAEQTNNNSSLSSSYYSNGGRAFAMGNNTSYTIPAGTYNFCSFTMAQGAKLRVTAGSVVRIFIDSPKRSGSGCGATTGKYVQGMATEVNREYGPDPAQLELYVYGRADDSKTLPGIDMGNAAWLYAAVYAPNASMNLLNGGNVYGAATVRNAQIFNNADFVHDSRVNDKTIPGTGTADSLGWFECARDQTGTDPESNCA